MLHSPIYIPNKILCLISPSITIYSFDLGYTRFSANAPIRRALVAVNCAFRAVCFRNPPRLLRSASSSQKVLRYFLGALLFFVFFGRFGCCDVCLYRRRADGVPRKSASVASDFLGLERRRLYIYTGTRRKPTRYSLSTKRYSTVHKSIYRFNACFLLFKVP